MVASDIDVRKTESPVIATYHNFDVTLYGWELEVFKLAAMDSASSDPFLVVIGGNWGDSRSKAR